MRFFSTSSSQVIFRALLAPLFAIVEPVTKGGGGRGGSGEGGTFNGVLEVGRNK